MDTETREKIEKTVLQILEESDMNETTVAKVRKAAAEKLGLDLSQSHYKAFVRHVVDSFLDRQKAKQEQDQAGEDEEEDKEEEEEEVTGAGDNDKEYDDNGDLIVCKLSDKRRVTIQEFRGKNLVSIREFYSKDGKELPSSKGISLTEDQWSMLRKNVGNIEEAIEHMKSQA